MGQNRRTFTEQERAFLSAIHADPRDDLPRLAYADWLDENGDSAQADFIRIQCEMARSVEVWRCPPCSPQEKRLVKKHGSRWLGQRLLSGNRMDKLSRLHFQGFHRGLPQVQHFTGYQGSGAEYAAELLELIAPHFQVAVLLSMYCTPGNDPIPMLANPVVSRAQQVTIWTSGIRDRATIDVPMPASVAAATVERFRHSKMLYIQIRDVSDEARAIIEKDLSPHVVTLMPARG